MFGPDEMPTERGLEPERKSCLQAVRESRHWPCAEGRRIYRKVGGWLSENSGRTGERRVLMKAAAHVEILYFWFIIITLVEA